MASPSSKAIGLRTAVIGLGRMGMRHIIAMKNLGMAVCGIADTSEAAVAAARNEHGIDPALCFGAAREMLSEVKPQALVVSTTAPSHAELVAAAAATGVRYILCEKPMATSLAEADRMIQACQSSGALLAINHQMRFMPQYTQVKELVGSSELGPLTSVLVAGSNFGLAMNASHYFEMFRYISGAPIESIQAWFEKQQLVNPRGAMFEDRSGRILATGESGASLYMDFSAEAGYGLQVVYICRLGQIVVDELNGQMRVAHRKSEFRELPTSRYGVPADVLHMTIEPADTVVPTMQVWLAMLGGDSYPDGITGLHALRCLVAAHISHQEGHRIALDDVRLPYSHQFKWA